MRGYITEYNDDCSSHLFGEAEFPNEWLENDVFAPCEFFLSKIDLSVFGGGLLDAKGYMYIFIDMPSSIKKAKPILRFCADEPDACTDFNDGFFDYELEPYGISKDSDGAVGESLVNEEKGNELILFSVCGEFIPEGLGVDRLTVSISKSSFIKHAYADARLSF